MNPLRYFLIPLAALAGIGYLLTAQYGNQWSGLIVLPLIIGAGVLSLGPQVKWWYWQRRAPDLSTREAPILEQFSLYQSLSLEDKREFRRRAFLFREAIQFIGKAIEKVPSDVQLMVAASAASVSFGRKDMLFPDFETVVFYNHNFPTPQHKAFHASELYIPEGTLLFNMPTFVRSVFEPHHFLHLGYYEYGRVYQQVYPGAVFPKMSWAEIEQISGFSQPKLEEFIGLSSLDRSAIGLVLYFTHAKRFQQLLPAVFAAYTATLKFKK
ncbi:MAG: zinc-dependent peptidase [Bacteroidota bacterium]